LFDRTRAFVKVQDGCHNRCTFCIVSAARGVERSVAAGAVVAEVNALHQAGYQEAVLTGVHLGAYGRDGRGDLRSLLDALLAETAIPRLRLSSLEPFDLAAEFFDRWQTSDGRLMPHLHLPAQAGSDATLRRMARRNSVADFESLVAAARDRIPGLTLTTDLIAGFPGESEADFAETLAFARRVAFAHVHVFAYSARAGTAAARMKDQVPQPERRRRSRVLNELGRELGDTVRTGALGQVRPVLWEHADTSLEAELVTWSGLTDNYLRVRTAVPASRVLHNRILPTRLERLDGQDLWGELIEPHHPPAGTSPHPPF
jgi:threonylcarbamoyladenosine tRNA methylthiotransferase MtaB